MCAKAAKRRATKKSGTPLWINAFFIHEAYRLAKLRKEVMGIDWHVDHIVPIHSEIVCGLHVHNNLQVIPSINNYRKSNIYWPDMP